jgi:hypothetical protein
MQSVGCALRKLEKLAGSRSQVTNQFYKANFLKNKIGSKTNTHYCWSFSQFEERGLRYLIFP